MIGLDGFFENFNVPTYLYLSNIYNESNELKVRKSRNAHYRNV